MIADAFAGKRPNPVDLHQLMRVMAATGRGGDTELVHITPHQRRILEKDSGKATVNPVTGLKEYFGPGAGPGDRGGGRGGGVAGGPGDAGGQGSDPSGSGPGSAGPGGVDPFGGVGVPDRGTAGRGDPTSGGAPSTGRGVGAGPEPGRASGPPGLPDAAPAPGTGPSAVGPAGTAAPSHGDPISSATGITRDDVVTALVESFVGAITGQVPGLREAGMLTGAPPTETVQSVPRGLATIAEALGTPSSKHGPATADPEGPTAFGKSGPSPQGADKQPIEPEPEPVPEPVIPMLERPAPVRIPAFLGIQNAMTPVQARSRIATFGVGGEGGSFRDPVAQDVLRNFIERAALTDEGEFVPDARLLPVETQYLRDVMGLDVQPTTPLEDIIRFWQGVPVPGPTPEPVVTPEPRLR